jgi:hypothetical protein
MLKGKGAWINRSGRFIISSRLSRERVIDKEFTTGCPVEPYVFTGVDAARLIATKRH